ncbi:MAG TPA: carbonic anhydrase [Acidimicrobiales bacterium]|nr:carbonic anhydrase [Acidimicrobiales bacterium]
MPPVIRSLLASLDERPPAPVGDRPREPARRLAVLTCMDARIDPLSALGLALGDAHVLRNAGGRVTDDVLRSLALSTHGLGVGEVGVIHHTGCGLHGVDNADLNRQAGLAGVDFLPFAGLEAGVAEDVARLVDSGYLAPGTVVWGAVYDLDAGVVSLVPEPG